MKGRKDFSAKGTVLDHPDFASQEDSIGDGDPNCPKCHGRGSYRVTLDMGGLYPPGITLPPVEQTCTCTTVKRIIYNMNRGWRGLSKAKTIRESRLIKYPNKNLWVTAKVETFQQNLKFVSIKKGPNWFFSVETDADLMQAWLAKAAMDGIDIYDPDVERPTSLEKLTLVDIALPPSLLIVHLGVKSAANKEMANVLQEAIAIRMAENKPTWIFDQPYAPLQDGHRAFSFALMDYLNIWGFKREILSHGSPAYQGFSESTSEGEWEPTEAPAPRLRPTPTEDAVVEDSLASVWGKGKSSKPKKGKGLTKKPFGR